MRNRAGRYLLSNMAVDTDAKASLLFLTLGLTVMNAPLIGSDVWLIQRIVVAFVKARSALDAVLSEYPGPHQDYDHYYYLRIPRRHRKFWKLIHTLSAEHPWIEPWKDSDVVDIRPSQGPTSVSAVRAAADVLCSEGIPASVEEHWK